MIELFLKDIPICELPRDVAMFYRLAAFANGTQGVPLRRLLFDNDKRITTFNETFPEIVEYIERIE